MKEEEKEEKGYRWRKNITSSFFISDFFNLPTFAVTFKEVILTL